MPTSPCFAKPADGAASHVLGAPRGDARTQARRRAYSEALEAWPNVRLSFESYCEHLDRLGHWEGAPPRSSELYLCAACLAGDCAAIRALERAHFAGLRRSLRRYTRDPDLIEEVLQHVRERLLVGPRPRIGGYRGGGPLGGWLKTVASRALLDHLKSIRSRQIRLEDDSVVVDPETQRDEWLERSGEEVDGLGEAVMKALRSLSRSDRSLVRAFYVEESSVAGLCQSHQVHRATLYRRLRRCEGLLRRQLREHVRRSVRAPEEDLPGLLARLLATGDTTSLVRGALSD